MEASIVGMRVLWALGFTAIGVVGTVGNAILGLAIWKTPSLQSKSGWLLAFLAIADGGQCFFGLLGAIENVRNLITGTQIPTWACLGFLEGARHSCLTAGTPLLVGLALDRYLMLRRPILYTTIDTRNYLATNAFGSLVVVAFQNIIVWSSLKPDYDDANAFCLYTYIIEPGLTETFLAPVYMSQMLFIIVTSIATMRWLRTHLNSLPAQDDQIERFQSSLKIVFYVYFATANPIVYYIRNAEYRATMRRTLRRPVHILPPNTVHVQSSF